MNTASSEDGRSNGQGKGLGINRSRIGAKLVEIENAAPLTALFKSFIDPVLVVVILYLLSFVFGVRFDGLHFVLAVISYVLTIQLMDGAFLFLPGEVRPWNGLGRFFFSWALFSIIILGTGDVSGLKSYFNGYYIVSWLVVAPLVMLGVHWVVKERYLVAHRATGRSLEKYVIIGANSAGVSLRDSIDSNEMLDIEFSGFFDDRSVDRLAGVGDDEILGLIPDVADYVRANRITKIFISLPMTSQPRVMSLLEDLKDSTASIYFVPDFFVFDLIQGQFDYVSEVPVICICESPFRGYRSIAKRLSDIILSASILVCIWPIMLLIAIAVKLTSKGPILFRQKRYGANGESIEVYKFRSMTVMEDGDTVTQAKKGDARLTPIGGFLRRASLDELPQFLNVLEGSMSIVGPRPHANAHNEHYRKLIKGYMVRHKVKPGITGWAQVNGLRGETDTLEKMENRVKYDLDYLRHWSIWLDFKIILMTLLLAFKKEAGAY